MIPYPEVLDAFVSIRDSCYRVLCQVNQEQRIPDHPTSLPPTLGVPTSDQTTLSRNAYETNTSLTSMVQCSRITPMESCGQSSENVIFQPHTTAGHESHENNVFSHHATTNDSIFTQHHAANFISPHATNNEPVTTQHVVEPMVGHLCQK